MGSYHVDHAPDHRFPRLYLSAATVVLAALVAVGIPSFSRVDVVVDGTPRVLPIGATASDMAARGWTAPSGDVLDADGAVVAQGLGEPARVMRGGALLEGDDRLADGDRLVTLAGADTVESLVTTRVPIPIEVQYQGEGPLATLIVPGAVGVEERIVGEYSGRVSTSTVLVQAQPMVVKRFSPSGGKVIALTFDDGPWPTYTEAVLKVLASENVKATFFLIGRQVHRYPELTRRIRDEGHTLGNHTQGHAYSYRSSPSVIRAQIVEAQAAIHQVAGVRPEWIRPPGGSLTPAFTQQSSRAGLKIAMWTIDPKDWKRPPAGELVRRVVGSARPGAVVLMHDGGGDRAMTVAALGPIIRELKKQGYTFVTLDELKP